MITPGVHAALSDKVYLGKTRRHRGSYQLLTLRLVLNTLNVGRPWYPYRLQHVFNVYCMYVTGD